MSFPHGGENETRGFINCFHGSNVWTNRKTRTAIPESLQSQKRRPQITSVSPQLGLCITPRGNLVVKPEVPIVSDKSVSIHQLGS